MLIDVEMGGMGEGIVERGRRLYRGCEAIPGWTGPLRCSWRVGREAEQVEGGCDGDTALRTHLATLPTVHHTPLSEF